MSTTINRQAQAVAEWTNIFPRQVTESYTSSLTFMKQLTVVAMSTITYLKRVFPEDNYTVDSLGGMKIRVLKDKCDDELPQFLSSALSHAFEAFEKKYLDKIVLCFYEKECKPENLVEYHAFEYHYTEDGVTMNINSMQHGTNRTSVKCTMENIRQQTQQLIRACVVIMQTSEEQVPDTCDVSLRLYYNDSAPEGYQAPGFLAAPDSDDPSSCPDFTGTKLGRVNTPYHRLELRTFMRHNLPHSREAIPSQTAPMMTQAGEEFSTSSDRAPNLCCSCTNYEDENDTSPLLTCFYCKTQQHAACYGLLPSDVSLITRHCCVACYDKDRTRTCSDNELAGHRKRDSFAVYRRSLALCLEADSICVRDLIHKLGLTPVTASKLTKLLHSHGILERPGTDLTTKVLIIREYLKASIKKHFQTFEKNIVDRLVEETIASQEKQPDPLGDILGPQKKQSLQNNTEFSRVIDASEMNSNDMEDLTLKQYREAFNLVEKMDEEIMPLSGSHIPVNDIDNNGNNGLKRKGGNVKTGVKTKKAKAYKK